MTKISFIVVAYNAAQSLDALLGDLFSQTIAPEQLEALLVDSASTDDTAQIMRRFAARAPFEVKLLENPKRWLASGINFIFIGAGLRNIPEELYESAAIDGAGYWKKLRNITLPCLSPTLFFQIIVNIINAFQSFTLVKLLTSGGPQEKTNLIVYSIYLDAFRNFRFGTAAARSIVLFVIIMVITLLQFSTEKRSVHY